MRPLTSLERMLVQWFADRVGECHRRQLLADLENAVADDDDFPIVQFHIGGYTGPPSGVERPLPVDAVVMDADRETVLVELLEDENGRLSSLEVNRCARGDVIDPDWKTLRQLAPGEAVDWSRRKRVRGTPDDTDERN